eukprot:m.43674 g.43674  ORF g.43674 m.43674 type:complete len:180 (-) comp12246_c0_seq2:46-585(-)
MEAKLLFSLIVRACLIVCCIIVFGAIADQGKYYGHSVFNDKMAAHDYGIAVGVIGFVCALAFLAMDLLLSRGSLPLSGTLYATIDLGVSAFNTLLTFIAFCYLADEWRRTEGKSGLSTSQKNAVQASIAFLFFSTILWTTSCILAFKARREGGHHSGYESAEIHHEPPNQYASFIDDHK